MSFALLLFGRDDGMILFFELIAKVEGDDVKAQDFFDRFRAKLGIPFNLLNSPFNRKRLFCDAHTKVYAFLLDIAWFKFYWLGLVLFFSFLLLKLRLGWFILPVIMMSMVVFWMPEFYLFLFRRGLRKAGYEGKVRRLNVEEFCEEVLVWDR